MRTRNLLLLILSLIAILAASLAGAAARPATDLTSSEATVSLGLTPSDGTSVSSFAAKNGSFAPAPAVPSSSAGSWAWGIPWYYWLIALVGAVIVGILLGIFGPVALKAIIEGIIIIGGIPFLMYWIPRLMRGQIPR